MRIILNTDIFTTEEFSKLTKDEFTKICNIVKVFAKEDADKVPLFKITSVYDITEDFINKSSFCIDYFDDYVEIKKFFSWIKGNKAAVAKSRMKKKQSIKEVIVKEIVENKQFDTVEEQSKERIEYDKIRQIFNDCFKDTNVPKVKILTDARKKLLKRFYEKMSKELADEINIYDFYEGYFDLIKDTGDKHFNLVKGWNNNRSNSWFQPDFDYFLKDKVFVQLREKV